MHQRPRFVSLRHSLFAVTLVAACSSPIDANDETDAASTGTADDASSTSGVGTSTTTAPSSTSGDGSTTRDDDLGSSGMDTASFLPTPDGGVGPAGRCLGMTEVGNLATVHALAEPEGELACVASPAPCGGDPVGIWTIAGHCGLDALPNFFEEQCPTSSMAILASHVEGSRTFAEDGTFVFDTALELDIEVLLDADACFGVDCETFGQLVDGQESGLSAMCMEVGDDSECSCLMTITNAGTSAGTYAIEEAGLVLTVDGQSADPVPYCLDGDGLTIWDPLHESRWYEDTPCEDAADCADALGDAHDTWVCAQE